MNRIKYLDIAKGFALTLMLIGHCYIPKKLDWITTFIFIFHMPLFFIACGYLSSPDINFNIKKKLKKIILPYFIVFVISIVPYYILYRDFDIVWIFLFMKTRSLLGLDTTFGIGPIWFLPCYFFSNYIIAKSLKYMSIQKFILLQILLFSLLYITSNLLHGLPFLLWQTSLGSLFIALGIICKNSNLLKYPSFIIIGIASTILCLLYGAFSMYSVICKLWIIQIIAAVFCTILIFEGSKRYIKKCYFLEFLSKNSLTILCIHSIDYSFDISSQLMKIINLSYHFQLIFYCIFILMGLLLIFIYKKTISVLT